MPGILPRLFCKSDLLVTTSITSQPYPNRQLTAIFFGYMHPSCTKLCL